MNNKAYFQMENNDTSGNNESALLYVTCNDICHSTKVQLN